MCRRARGRGDYLSGGRSKGYYVKHECENPTWTHLVIQASTVNGVGGDVRWDVRPWARPHVQAQLRGQLSPVWELNPFRTVHEKMRRPLL
eukprot:11339108-Alexandrium_andersonii.AAC.1